jgi:tRNA(Ile)-lysidine synthase
MRESVGATCVALGHTADDRAETVLLNLLRGAGTRGLSSMRPRRGVLVRPLILARRQETEGYCRRRGLRPRRDRTNESADFARNRVRAEALPLLSEIAGHDVVPSLVRAADVLEGDEDLLTELTRGLGPLLVRARRADEVAVRPAALWGLHGSLARRVVRELVAELRGGLQDLSLEHVEDILALAAPGASGAVHVPGGVQAERTPDGLKLRLADARAQPAAEPYEEVALAVPGQARHDGLGVTLTARLIAPEEARPGGPADEAFVDAEATGPWLVVRSWRPGDRFRPLGLNGSKKLQDFLAVLLR